MDYKNNKIPQPQEDYLLSAIRRYTRDADGKLVNKEIEISFCIDLPTLKTLERQEEDRAREEIWEEI